MARYRISSVAVLSLLAATVGCAPIANIHCDVPESLLMWPGEKPCNCGDACEPIGEADEQCIDDASSAGLTPGMHLASYSSGLVQTAAGTMLSVVGTTGAAVGAVANYFIPVSKIAPPDVPPPGRFHPVPTTPVFAPRS